VTELELIREEFKVYNAMDSMIISYPSNAVCEEILRLRKENFELRECRERLHQMHVRKFAGYAAKKVKGKPSTLNKRRR